MTYEAKIDWERAYAEMRRHVEFHCNTYGDTPEDWAPEDLAWDCRREAFNAGLDPHEAEYVARDVLADIARADPY